MIIALICTLLFLFTVFQLSKDDFLFIRKGVLVENIFNTVFLTLPVALFSARFFYVFFHPSWKYLNPFIFFVIPYFPGLSIVGGMVGAWLFINAYTKNKKIPSARLLDMVSLSFLLALSVGIFLNAFFSHNRIIFMEELGRSVLGIVIYIIFLLRFIKGAWIEGSIAFLIICTCCVLSAIQLFTLFALHQPLALVPLIADGILFILSLSLFIQKQKFISRLLGK